MKKLILAVLCLALSISVFAGPQNNSLIIGTNQEPNQLNPWEGAADTKENVMGLLYTGFTYFDSQGNLQPGLATEVPTPANGRVRITRDAAGKFVSQEVDWTIRANAKWSDGTDITTADVTFTYEVQQHPLVPVTFRTFSNIIKEIKVKDGKNFTLVYKDPNLFFASPTGRLGLARFYDLAAKHVWDPIFRAAVQEAQANQSRAAEIMQQRFLGADPATGRDASKVVGSGPYKLAEWQRNQFTRLTRRSDFFLAPPGGDASKYVQEVTVRYFTASETLLAAILSGELDASDDIGLAGQDPANLRTRLGNNGSIEVSPSGFIEQLIFNKFTKGAGDASFPVCQTADDLQLNDKRTRQAIALALNRDEIRTVFPGAIVSNSFVVRGDTGFNPNLKPYARSVEQAKALLAALGWADSGGVLARKTADGRTVFFRLPHVTTPATFRVNTQAIVQRQLRDVGIALEIANQPASVLFSTNFVSGSNCNWQGLIEFASAGGIGEVPADELSGELWADDPDTAAAFDNVPRPSNGFAGSNQSGWNNKDYDKLHFQALSEFDLNKRSDIIKQMQVIMNEELPFIPLYERVEILSTKTGLVNYTKGTPLTRTPTWNAWEWGWSQNGAQKVR